MAIAYIDPDPNKSWGTNINVLQTVADQNTNRVYAPNDPSHAYVDYDAAGNQTKDYLTWNGTRTYDAESRMKTATDSSNITSTYVYDGSGKRIKRIVNGVETWQIYGLVGELLAEYPATMSPANPQKEYGYRNGELLVTQPMLQRLLI
jgi:YD repeat-containing protein